MLFKGLDMTDRTISGEELIFAILEGERNFEGIYLTDFNFFTSQNYVALRQHLGNNSLSSLRFDGASFNRVKMIGLPLQGVSMRRVDARYLDFRRAALHDADFTNAKMYHCHLPDAGRERMRVEGFSMYQTSGLDDLLKNGRVTLLEDSGKHRIVRSSSSLGRAVAYLASLFHSQQIQKNFYEPRE